jgi:hypothetical protein
MQPVFSELRIPPVIDILHWRPESKRGMLTGAIIKEFNRFKTSSLHFSLGSVTQAMAALVFVTVEQVPGRRIIPTVCLAPHREVMPYS